MPRHTVHHGARARTTTTVGTGPSAAREAARARISFGPGMADNEYGTNIQIADLSASTAALAVIAWKKMTGFCSDLGRHPLTPT